MITQVVQTQSTSPKILKSKHSIIDYIRHERHIVVVSIYLLTRAIHCYLQTLRNASEGVLGLDSRGAGLEHFD